MALGAVLGLSSERGTMAANRAADAVRTRRARDFADPAEISPI